MLRLCSYACAYVALYVAGFTVFLCFAFCLSLSLYAYVYAARVDQALSVTDILCFYSLYCVILVFQFIPYIVYIILVFHFNTK